MVRDESRGLGYTIVSHPLGSSEDVARGERLARRIGDSLGLGEREVAGLAKAVSEYGAAAARSAEAAEITFELELNRLPRSLRVAIEEPGGAQGTSRGEGLAASVPTAAAESDSEEAGAIAFSPSGEGGSGLVLSVELSSAQDGLGVSDLEGLQERALAGESLDLRETVRHQVHDLAALVAQLDERGRDLEAARAQLAEYESLLNRPDNLLELALGSIPDPVFLVNAEFRIEFANEPARTLADAWGAGALALPEPLRERVQEAAKRGKDWVPTGVSGTLRRRFGPEERSFLPRVTLLHTADGDLRGAVVLLSDVTEFHLLEDLKSDLLGTVSHEIKSPVTAIRMGLRLLMDERVGSLNDGQRELIDTAKTEVERLIRTLDNLLDVARFKGGDLHLSLSGVAPKDLLDRALAEMRPVAERKSIALELAKDAGDACGDFRVRVDVERMVFAFNNLLSNAIKHSPAGGTVRIGCEVIDGSARIRFWVADEGPGIPAPYREKIFNRFVRVPGDTEAGSGLGLTVAREFVQAHGGEVGLVSQEGPGCEFFVLLPVEAAQGVGQPEC